MGESVLISAPTEGFQRVRPAATGKSLHRFRSLFDGLVTGVDFAHDDTAVWTTTAASERELIRQAGVLNQDDRDEIGQVRHEAVRKRKIAGRVALRRALTHAVDGQIPASAWRFAKSVNGRPFVAPGLPQVHFSVTHTDGLSAIAVSRTRPVGIDIEAEPCCVDPEFIQAFLSRREQAGLERLSQTERMAALVQLWTLKEAYTKLVGIGLAADLRSFEFDLEPPRLMHGCEAADEELATRFKLWRSPGSRGFCHVALAVGQQQMSRQP